MAEETKLKTECPVSPGFRVLCSHSECDKQYDINHWEVCKRTLRQRVRGQVVERVFYNSHWPQGANQVREVLNNAEYFELLEAVDDMLLVAPPTAVVNALREIVVRIKRGYHAPK